VQRLHPNYVNDVPVCRINLLNRRNSYTRSVCQSSRSEQERLSVRVKRARLARNPFRRVNLYTRAREGGGKSGAEAAPLSPFHCCGLRPVNNRVRVINNLSGQGVGWIKPG
jgi:hypothetical protein